MANNIDIKFSGQVKLKSAKYLYTGTHGNDCLRALHTNFYNSSYAYNTSEISTSNFIDPEKAFNRNEDDFATAATTNFTLTINNYKIRPHTVGARLASQNTSSYEGFNIRLGGLNEGNQFTSTIGANITLAGPDNYLWTNLQEDINLRRGWVNKIYIQTIAPVGVRIYELYVYGEIIHKDELDLPPTSGATTIEAFTDSLLLVDELNEGSIIKDGSLMLEPRRAHTVQRVNLSGTYTIPDHSEYNVWNFNPDGASRIVNLPRAPQFNHYLKINNIDGGQQIRVNDSDKTTLIQNLSTADGPNTLEAVWANNQWIITA